MEKNEVTDKRSASVDASANTKHNDCLMIPKHRFDCVNLCLKETRLALKNKSQELEYSRARIQTLESELLEAKVETALASARAKDVTAAKALIDFSDLKPECDGTIPNLERQILRLKESRDYLFEKSENVNYVLLPVKNGDALNKSIANYIKKYRGTGK